MCMCWARAGTMSLFNIIHPMFYAQHIGEDQRGYSTEKIAKKNKCYKRNRVADEAIRIVYIRKSQPKSTHLHQPQKWRKISHKRMYEITKFASDVSTENENCSSHRQNDGGVCSCSFKVDCKANTISTMWHACCVADDRFCFFFTSSSGWIMNFSRKRK